MTRRPAVVLGALAVLLVTTAAAAVGTAPLALPTAAELQRTVDVLAAPGYAGRRSGTPEGDRAARQLARWLADAGLRPGGDDGTFLQEFVLESVPRPSHRSVLRVGETSDLESGTAWVPHGGSTPGEVAAPLVFVGYGIADAAGWDDYAGVDVRGRIALALEGGPPHLPGANTSRLDKLIAARRRGAAALLLVAGDRLPAPRATGAPVRLVSAAVTRAGADALLHGAGLDLAGLERRMAATRRPASVDIPKTVRLRVAFTADDVTAANVIGILPGTDPALAGEAVVIGAHYDHVGVVAGALHPGADDNASGTAVALGLARAFATAGGAERTLVFTFFGAEELGLIGSAHYVRRPAWPLDRTVAMLNFDMVGRMREERLMVGGVDSGTGLRPVVERAAQAAGVRAELRPTPFSPSDHARFYGAGTPVLFFFTGLHEDYHRPGDTADRVNADGMARVAAVGARITHHLAARPAPTYVKLEPPRRRGGPVTTSSAPVFLGVGADAARGWDGVPVSHVVPGSTAARAGLRDGDVLVRLGGAALDSFDDLRAALRDARPGQTVRIVYLRDGVDHAVTATLEEPL